MPTPDTDTGAPVEAIGRAYTVTDALLRLLFSRQMYLVGKAMAEAYPTDDDIEDLITDPDAIEQLKGVALVVDDIRHQRAREGAHSLEAMISVLSQHYDRAVEEVELFAEQHGVSPEDLLVVLTRDQ